MVDTPVGLLDALYHLTVFCAWRVMELVVVTGIDTCSERKLHPPTVVLADGQTITDAHTTTDGRCLTIMVLLAVITIKSKIVICQAEMYPAEESVILFRQPIAEFRLQGKCSEFDG